jgi:hypothetical protein
VVADLARAKNTKNQISTQQLAVVALPKLPFFYRVHLIFEA